MYGAHQECKEEVLIQREARDRQLGQVSDGPVLSCTSDGQECPEEQQGTGSCSAGGVSVGECQGKARSSGLFIRQELACKEVEGMQTEG